MRFTYKEFLDSWHLYELSRSRSVSYQRFLQIMHGFKLHMDRYEVNTKERIAMFWAQMAHETGGFKWLHELGSDKYLQYLEGRKDLGNVKKGDGPKYKGRGLIHLTGRANYRTFGQKIGVDLEAHPHLAERPDIAVLVALEYWKDKNLNKYADKRDIKKVTKLINGGYNGLKDRQKYYEKALQIFILI